MDRLDAALAVVLVVGAQVSFALALASYLRGRK
jgi:hypothetical protein